MNPKSKNLKEPSKKTSLKVSSARVKKLVVVVIGLSGAAALVYEVVWTRVLSLVFGSSTYALSTMLTAFMSGLALGSFLGGRLVDKSRRHFYILGLIEIGIGIFGVFSVLLIDSSQFLYFRLYQLAGGSFGVFVIGQFLIGLLIMIVPTTLMGATFPVASKIYTTEINVLGKRIGDLYSINTLGSIIGSFAAGFVLMPLLGVNHTALVAGLINIFAGCAILILEKSVTSIAAGLLIALIPLAGLYIKAPDYYPFNLHSLGLFKSFEEFSLFRSALKNLFFSEDVNGQVAVFQEPSGQKFLRVGGRVEGSDGMFDMPAQVVSGRLPLEYYKKAKSALVIGLGTGITLSRVAKYPSLKEIDCVEINSSVRKASKLFFSGEKRSFFSDHRVKVKVADGRNYLLVSRKKYDVISSEPSYPTSQGVANLFTDGFYKLVKKHLSRGGVLCQWAPKYIFSIDEYKILTKTMGRHFRNLLVVDMGGDALFLCSDMDLAADKALVERLLREEKLSVQVLNVWKLSRADLDRAKRDPTVQVNTDNNAILEYRAIRNILTKPPATL